MFFLKQPLVSIYIPTHNRSQLLCRAIDSLLAQSYSNIEILVCSDGSTDDTDERMAQYCSNYSHIYYLKNEQPQGACKARNKCIQAAQGEYITGLDDDDLFHPKRVELLLKHFDPEYSFLCSQGCEIDLNTVNVDFNTAELTCSKYELINLSKLLDENIVGNQIFTLTYRLKDIGGFDEEMPAWQDYDTWVRMIKQFGVAKKIFKELYYSDIDHRRSRISVSSNRYLGCKRFYSKYEKLLTNQQKKNAEVRLSIIGGKHLTTIELLKLFNIKKINYWLKAWLIKFGLS